MTSHEFLPLATAARTAYLTLAGRPETRAELAPGLLDVVAIALAACMPIYGARGENEAPRRLGDVELAAGHFVGGAARLRFPDGAPPLTWLAVARGDFAEGIARLRKAGVNFSQARFEPAPRRVPRITPELNAA